MNKSTLGNLSSLKTLANKATNPVAETPDLTVNTSKIVVTVQIRRKFKNLDELAESIKVNGILAPLLVTALPDGTYKLIAGERRLRAASLLGLKEVPIKIKRGLDERQARQIQIAENMEREDLSLAEEAAAIIEDVQHYGVEETGRLWNRSVGWVSKRNATRQYRELAKSALEAELTGDLELLHALNQLEAADAKAAGQVLTRLKEGQPVFRDEVRNAVARAKTWAKESRSAKKSAANDDGGRDHRPPQQDDAVEPQDPTGITGDQSTQVPEAAPTGASTQVAAKRPQQQPSQSAVRTSASDEAVSDSPQLAVQLATLRSRIYADGQSVGGAVGNLPAQLHALGMEQQEGEWVLWTAFLDTVLPPLSSLGSDRAVPYLKRLIAELKSAAPQQMWEQIHSDDKGDAQPAPSRPEDWRF